MGYESADLPGDFGRPVFVSSLLKEVGIIPVEVDERAFRHLESWGVPSREIALWRDEAMSRFSYKPGLEALAGILNDGIVLQQRQGVLDTVVVPGIYEKRWDCIDIAHGMAGDDEFLDSLGRVDAEVRSQGEPPLELHILNGYADRFFPINSKLTRTIDGAIDGLSILLRWGDVRPPLAHLSSEGFESIFEGVKVTHTWLGLLPKGADPSQMVHLDPSTGVIAVDGYYPVIKGKPEDARSYYAENIEVGVMAFAAKGLWGKSNVEQVVIGESEDRSHVYSMGFARVLGFEEVREVYSGLGNTPKGADFVFLIFRRDEGGSTEVFFLHPFKKTLVGRRLGRLHPHERREIMDMLVVGDEAISTMEVMGV